MEKNSTLVPSLDLVLEVVCSRCDTQLDITCLERLNLKWGIDTLC